MIAIEDFGGKLKSLGLAQYEDSLVENGFDDWRTILDITEQDLVEMGFKLGHRRVLQREISQYRSGSSSGSSCGPQFSSNDKRSVSMSTTRSMSTETPPPAAKSVHADKRNKRRYRWHPRPDANAPKRPKTAYVQFADQLRAQPEIGALSFVDIAREVGRQWQNMAPSVKTMWEDQATKVGHLIHICYSQY
jgi:hypothetical protein